MLSSNVVRMTAMQLLNLASWQSNVLQAVKLCSLALRRLKITGYFTVSHQKDGTVKILREEDGSELLHLIPGVTVRCAPELRMSKLPKRIAWGS